MHKRPNLCDYHLFHYRGFNYKVRCQVIGKGNTTCLFIKYLYPMPLASLLYCTFIINYQGRSIKSKAPFLCTFIIQLTLNFLPYFKSYQWKKICTQWHINQHTIRQTHKASNKAKSSFCSMHVIYDEKSSQFTLAPMDSLFLWNAVGMCHKRKQTHWANILKSQHTRYLTNIQGHVFFFLSLNLLSYLPPVIINDYFPISMLIMIKDMFFIK